MPEISKTKKEGKSRPEGKRAKKGQTGARRRSAPIRWQSQEPCPSRAEANTIHLHNVTGIGVTVLEEQHICSYYSKYPDLSDLTRCIITSHPRDTRDRPPAHRNSHFAFFALPPPIDSPIPFLSHPIKRVTRLGHLSCLPLSVSPLQINLPPPTS